MTLNDHVFKNMQQIKCLESIYRLSFINKDFTNNITERDQIILHES